MRTALVLGAVVAAALFAGVAFARLTQSSSVDGNTITYDSLDAPTSLSAGGGVSISLNWTATSDTYATGHRILRGTASGGPYSQVAQVTPRTTTTYSDSPGFGTYYYVARAYFQNWESPDGNETSAAATSTGYVSCTANAAVTSGSGDNNGFQTTPGNACADDASRALDTNSGSSTAVGCSSTNKDRHLYYNYGVTIPSGTTIDGIEVRLDAWADATTGAPLMCVELSWDGGTSWTTAKTTSTLTTSQATYTLGTPSDTWGRTWAVSDFTNANFRLRITNVASSTARDFSLDWVSVRVTGTPP